MTRRSQNMSVLGDKLRDARIEKGYTLNTLQQLTKIQKKYLVAIEEGNFKELPGSFYIRAFVKQYADIVGLNGDELLETYESELNIDAGDSVYPVIENIESEELGSRVKARQGQKDQDTIEILLSYLPVAFVVGIILLIVVSLLYALSRQSRNSNQTQESTSTSIVSTVEPEEAVTSTNNASTDGATSDNTTLGENQIRVGSQVLTLISQEGEETVYEISGSDFSNYEFSAKGTAFVWLGLYEDEVMVVDQTIAQDEIFTYKVNEGVKSFRMRLGYPEGATFMVNGTSLEINNSYFPGTVVFRVKENSGDDQASTQEETVTEEVVSE